MARSPRPVEQKRSPTSRGSARSPHRSSSASFSSSRTTQRPQSACSETFSQTRGQRISTRGVMGPWPSSLTSRSTGTMSTRPWGWRGRRSHALRTTASTSTRTPPSRTERWEPPCCMVAISTAPRSISSGPSRSHAAGGRAATSPWRSFIWGACVFARATVRPPATPWPLRVLCSLRRTSRGSRDSTASLRAHLAPRDAGRGTRHRLTG